MSDESVVSIARFEAGSTGEISGTLKAPYVTNLPSTGGYVVPLANVLTLTLTLTDAATGAVVNGRSAQNILNTNGVTVSSQGTLVWSIAALDTTLLDPPAKSEEHIGQFVCTYNMNLGKGIETLRFSWRLFCSRVTGLCLFDDVRLIAKGVPDSERLLIERMIDAFTLRVERQLGRNLDFVTGFTEVLTPFAGYEVRVSHYPIVSISSVKESEDGTDFASITPLEPTEYYSDSNGLIRKRWAPFIGGPRTVQVVYTGGLARETGAVPAELRETAAEQVAKDYLRLPSLGLSSESVNGVSVQHYEQDWMEKTKAMVASYRARFP